jgi:hypothetical protein
VRYRVEKAIANTSPYSYLSRIGKNNFSSLLIQKIGEDHISPGKIKLFEFEKISKFYIYQSANS